MFEKFFQRGIARSYDTPENIEKERAEAEEQKCEHSRLGAKYRPEERRLYSEASKRSDEANLNGQRLAYYDETKGVVGEDDAAVIAKMQEDAVREDESRNEAIHAEADKRLEEIDLRRQRSAYREEVESIVGEGDAAVIARMRDDAAREDEERTESQAA